MIRIQTDNHNRTIDEMAEMFRWCMKSFGDPIDPDRVDVKTGWTYGKEPGMFGRTFVDGPFDIEYIDFQNEEDAVVFKLQWGSRVNHE